MTQFHDHKMVVSLGAGPTFLSVHPLPAICGSN